MSWEEKLATFDPKYFGDIEYKNFDVAAHRLATWFFDNTKAKSLKKMISKLPEELWVMALKKWAAGDHDT